MATFRTFATTGGTSGTTDRALTATPAVGDLWVVFIALSGNTNATPTCSDDNGGTYTLIMRAAWNASADNMACFVRNQLFTNTTSTTLTVASGSNTAGQIGVIMVSGMAKTGAAAVRSSGSQANQAASTTPTPVLNQAALTANMTIAAVASGDTTTTPPTVSPMTEALDASQSTPTTALEVCYRNSGFTGTSIAFGATQATVYASMAIELDGSLGATLSKTLAPTTVAATATVDSFATLSKSLAPATVSGVVTVDVFATFTKTLAPATVAATATIEQAVIVADLSKTLAPATVAATAAVLVQANASPTLAPATVSAAATSAITAAVSKTLGSVVLATQAIVPVAGQVLVFLSPATVAATAAVLAQANAAPVLAPATIAATAGVLGQASAATTLAPATVAATAAVLVQVNAAPTLAPATVVSDITITAVVARFAVLNVTLAPARVSAAFELVVVSEMAGRAPKLRRRLRPFSSAVADAISRHRR